MEFKYHLKRWYGWEDDAMRILNRTYYFQGKLHGHLTINELFCILLITNVIFLLEFISK